MNYPEHRPRRLRRSRNDRWIGGVCGGIAEYLNMDATLVRVAVVIIALVTTVVPVAAIYLLLMLLLPEADPEQRGSIGPAPRFGWPSSQQQSPPRSDSVWGSAGPPWRPQRDPNIDTSAPQPPRQNPADLFKRAKHPTQPTSQPTTPPAAPPTERPAPTEDQQSES